MSELKHSAAPWEIVPDDDEPGDLVILSKDIYEVAHVSRCYKGDRVPEKEMANARLIAAAPELLTALQEALIDFRADHYHDHPTAVQWRALIIKATSEPPSSPE
jgi:hypothetical protein